MYTVVLQYFRLPDMENLELIKNSDCRQDKTSKQMGLQNVLHVDVAIKSYAISILTGSTFDGFIDCTKTKR